MGVLSTIFTWWNGPGVGTRLVTRRTGREVGRDARGNIYYASKAAAEDRRWVIYAGPPEASDVPPEWHAWLHRQVDAPPSERPLKARVWERPWIPNATGTPLAHAPSGSLSMAGKRSRASDDYEAWSPE